MTPEQQTRIQELRTLIDNENDPEKCGGTRRRACRVAGIGNFKELNDGND